MSIVLNWIRRALSSVVLKISLAAIFIVQAIILTGERWCGFHHMCPRESFLTRADASVCVLLGAVFLFLAAKPVLRSLIARRPLAYEGKTTAPMDLNQDENLNIWVPLDGDLEPITGPDWWVDTGIDA